MIKKVFYLLIFSMFLCCGQSQVAKDSIDMTKYDTFINKEKFRQDPTSFYPGISDPKLLPVLSEKINQAAVDFKNISLNNPTEEKYQGKIREGLNRFSDIYLKLDTEDREKICSYFEELMDIAGVESSGGLLNDFMYGFDPAKKM
ncbi:hypothetical protein Q765_12130 [Flavobacterium rivuli WB 3.3-2 = DSM 21788]|uniref:DUF4844 domain-containing protein n=1 Tax=Flavobacterium rivuli WB 3.3-2 = DSM 21788 TaxID=1121895 RepID=A0A0A2M109_9FLAO|nr:DUF4844 domain-containing protein [Flavobacterium rivuli]KGO86317.1 hypothetical protein Q765_12130 [Flavobacterium rivuli WB 3.3-2 = DSM 21788]